MSNLLMIEDDARLAGMVSEYLGASGFVVSHAPDAQTGLARLQSAGVDLVILDLMLPGCSGLEILEAIRAHPETSRTPVMMLTAKGQGRDREAAERAGVDRFMTKPFSNSEMIASVRELVRR